MIDTLSGTTATLAGNDQYIPDIPAPMPGIAPFGAFSGICVMTASMVSNRDAIDAACCSADRTTFVGSITPASTRFSNVSVCALNPSSGPMSRTRCTTIEPSSPALVAIQRIGSSIARLTVRTPICSSPSSFSVSSTFEARRSATPPPGTMPSSTAALVACIASSTRAFRSFISVSVAAPTLMMATPPTSLASRSWSFSRS